MEIRSRACEGVAWEALLDLVWDATPEASRPVLDEIADQVREYQNQPPPARHPGMSDDDYGRHCEDEDSREHGFVTWMFMLQMGEGAIPEVLPPAVLLAWRDGYTHHPCNRSRDDGLRASPIPALRCEGCRLVLPNAITGGHLPPVWEACPACRGTKFARRNLGWMTEGDPVFVSPSRR